MTESSLRLLSSSAATVHCGLQPGLVDRRLLLPAGDLVCVLEREADVVEAFEEAHAVGSRELERHIGAAGSADALRVEIDGERSGAVHRNHPLLEGLRNIVVKGAFYYRRALQQPGVLEKYGKGTPNDWLERHIFTKRAFLGIVLMLGIDMYLFGFFVGPVVWGIQMIWIPFWAAGIVNGVGHALGYRNFDVKDESRNIAPIAIWLGGEELHNNHHHDPHSAKFRAKWYELDIGWVYIRLLSLFGLAHVNYARS